MVSVDAFCTKADTVGCIRPPAPNRISRNNIDADNAKIILPNLYCQPVRCAALLSADDFSRSDSSIIRPPDKVLGSFSPALLCEKDGRRLYDCGENISGWATVRCCGRPGEAVTVRYAEKLAPDGKSLDYAAGGEGQIQEDRFLCGESPWKFSRYASAATLDTGIFGTPVLLERLFREGGAETAFRLLSGTSPASFGRMMQAGATTLWEYWDGQHSHNHPMFGSVVKLLFTEILGIRQAKDSYGFQNYTVEPAHILALRWMEGSVRTEAGTISVR